MTDSEFHLSLVVSVNDVEWFFLKLIGLLQCSPPTKKIVFFLHVTMNFMDGKASIPVSKPISLPLPPVHILCSLFLV